MSFAIHPLQEVCRHKVHRSPVPLVGGLAIYVLLVTAVLIELAKTGPGGVL